MIRKKYTDQLITQTPIVPYEISALEKRITIQRNFETNKLGDWMWLVNEVIQVSGPLIEGMLLCKNDTC
jgi:hypothetical protein